MTFNRILELAPGVTGYQGKAITGAIQSGDGWVALVNYGSLLQSSEPGADTVAVLELVDPWVRDHIVLPDDLQVIVAEHLAKKAAFDGRRESRRDRLQARAEKKRAESNAHYQRSRNLVDPIPFGQPILVGHHSERDHRGRIERSHNAMRKSVALDRYADNLEGRAASVGSAGISSDDPDGRFKLKANLEKAEALQAEMKAINKALRKKDPDTALKALGFSDKKIQEIKTPDFAGRVGCPSYMLQNNNAQIRRFRERIKELEAASKREDYARAYGDALVLELDTTDNRVRLKFDDIPSEGDRKTLKRNGFKWSRMNQAWQRQATPVGVRVAEYVAAQLSGVTEPEAVAQA